MSSRSGYNTYVLGTGGEIQNSKELLLCKKADYADLGRVYISNLLEMYPKILSRKKYVILEKDSDSGKFIFNKLENQVIDSFDTIIYIGVLDKPIGFTDFFNLQGEEDTVIYINLGFNIIKGIVKIEVLNSLAQIKSGLPKEFLKGEKPLNFAEDKRFSTEDINLPPIHYTNSISNLLSSRGEICLIGSAICDGRKFDVNILRNLPINHHRITFNNFQVFYYKGDIVLAEWVDTMYNVVSLTRTDFFDNAYSYTESPIGYLEVPKKEGELPKGILNFNGNIAEVEFDKGRLEYYDSISKEWVSDSTKVSKYLKNSWDIKEKVRVITQGSINAETVSINFQEILNTSYDYLSNRSEILKWIGDWIVFKEYSSGKVVYSNYKGFLKFSSNSKVIPVNDNLLLVDNESSYELLDSNSNKISIIDKKEKIINTYLDLLRKNIISNPNLTVPSIVASFKGYLFYLDEENKLNYL